MFKNRKKKSNICFCFLMICDNNFLNNQLCGEMSMTNGYSEKVLYFISLKIVGHCNTIVYPAEQVTS